MDISSSMRSGRRRIGLLGAVVIGVALLGAPVATYAANAYGQVFAGQQKCLECHGGLAGKWAVGQYTTTSHGLFVQDVVANPAAMEPTSGASTLWPSPAWGGGLSFGPADILWQVGHPGQVHEFVSKYKNGSSRVISTGYTVNPTSAGPADDWWIFDPLNFSPAANMWELEKPVGVAPYFQGCGGCHFLGVTRPSNVATTLASGASMTPSTETSYSGVGIQCENCHGTGKVGDSTTAHWTTGVQIVRTKRALESQTCAQCHVTGTAKELRLNGKTFSQPNGFTTDRNINDFFDVYGASFVQTSPSVPAPVIPADDPRYFPSGHNKNGNHFYYNEWMLTPHARSLHYADGSHWTGSPRETCLGCHSGEGFLKRLGYGADDYNDIGAFPSNLASDTLDIECSVCHTVHAKTGEALGLRLPADELCVACHSGRLAPGSTAAPGSHPRYTQQEMLEGYGLIGVPRPATRFMREAECVDCHMPQTRPGRYSHSFEPMLPGDAVAWGMSDAADDSCTPCHRGSSRTELQHDIDGWNEDVLAATEDASAALAAGRARSAAATPAGTTLLGAAQTNLWFVTADLSNGVHNYPYAMAGLEKAELFADAVGASFSRMGMTSYNPYYGLAAFFGRLVLGDGTAQAGQPVSVEARPGGSALWTPVGVATTDVNGDFILVVAPTGTTEYRAVWAPLDAATAVVSGSQQVVFHTSTSVRASSSRVRVRRYATITGSVSPTHAGQVVSVSYKYGRKGWRRFATATIDAAGNYRATLRLTSRGYYYFSARFAGDPSHVGSVSGTARVKSY